MTGEFLPAVRAELRMRIEAELRVAIEAEMRARAEHEIRDRHAAEDARRANGILDGPGARGQLVWGAQHAIPAVQGAEANNDAMLAAELQAFERARVNPLPQLDRIGAGFEFVAEGREIHDFHAHLRANPRHPHPFGLVEEALVERRAAGFQLDAHIVPLEQADAQAAQGRQRIAERERRQQPPIIVPSPPSRLLVIRERLRAMAMQALIAAVTFLDGLWFPSFISPVDRRSAPFVLGLRTKQLAVLCVIFGLLPMTMALAVHQVIKLLF
jgi:hypothetical protein